MFKHDSEINFQLLNRAALLWSPHIFKLLFHNASLFNPVYKLLGVATSLGLHFPMEALIYR